MGKKIPQVQTSADWMYYQSTAIPHNCEVRNEVDDLELVIPGKGTIAKCRRAFRGFFLASHKNKRAIRLHRSHASIRFERSRQLRLHPYMIHPLSSFRVFWEMFMLLNTAFSNFIGMYFQAFPFGEQDVSFVKFMKYIKAIYITEIGLNFITGTVCEITRQITLDFKTVARNYIKGPLIIDLIIIYPSNLSYTSMMTSDLSMNQKEHLAIFLHSLSFMSGAARIYRSIRYLKHTCKVLGLSHEPQVYLFFSFIIVNYFHYVACLVYYISEVLDTVRTGKKMNSWFRGVVADRDTTLEIYSSSLVRTITTSMGLCLQFTPANIEDQLTTTILSWLGQIFFLMVVGKYLQLACAKHASSTRYDAMMTQVKQFMDSRKLPRRLQLQVIEFYEFRYQRAFFNQPKVLHSISSQLKQDFMYQRCKDLVSKVAFFSDLPVTVLVRIVSFMRIEYFLGNEEVIRLHSASTQMYFIKSGTVAVYSATGREVCHLEDGNHFGEIALVMTNIKRVASVVTLEKCELFVLQRDDFNRAMAAYPEYLDKIRKTALKRLERTMRMENTNAEEIHAYLKNVTTK